MALTHTRTFTTCDHRDGSRITADVLQGDGDHDPFPVAVQWCRVCGAYRVVVDPHGRDGEPRPREWVEPEGPDGQGVRFY